MRDKILVPKITILELSNLLNDWLQPKSQLQLLENLAKIIDLIRKSPTAHKEELKYLITENLHLRLKSKKQERGFLGMLFDPELKSKDFDPDLLKEKITAMQKESKINVVDNSESIVLSMQELDAINQNPQEYIQKCYAEILEILLLIMPKIIKDLGSALEIVNKLRDEARPENDDESTCLILPKEE